MDQDEVQILFSRSVIIQKGNTSGRYEYMLRSSHTLKLYQVPGRKVSYMIKAQEQCLDAARPEIKTGE